MAISLMVHWETSVKPVCLTLLQSLTAEAGQANAEMPYCTQTPSLLRSATTGPPESPGQGCPLVVALAQNTVDEL